ncbi:MAG: hypothetical protein ISR48_01290 [Alphaproteobacteria bacterium]|nr:hypothetical protein [Alphaproteobacteria bacterium]
MAYNSQDLSVLAYANGFTLWHYKSTGDALSAIMAANYFDSATDMLRVGDSITVQDSSNDIAIIRVSANSGGAVTVVYATPQSAANADTSSADLATLETEVNEIKAALRSARIIAT